MMDARAKLEVIVREGLEYLDDPDNCMYPIDMEALKQSIVSVILQKWRSVERAETEIMPDEPKVICGFVKDGEDWIAFKPYRLDRSWILDD